MARNDMRIDVDFIDHPKTKRLIRMVGYEGFYCLMKLFSIAAKIYKTGDLKNCDSFDIEDITGWTGEEGKLVEALTDAKIGFLEKCDGHYFIHDWEKNQPWIYNSEARSEQARSAVQTRWEKHNTERILNVLPTDTDRNSPSPIPTPIPTPTPTPTPTPKIHTVATNVAPAEPQPKRFTKPTIEEVATYCNERSKGVKAQEWYDHYESNGWRVGKTPMKDWKAAVRTWEHNEINSFKTQAKQKFSETRECYPLDIDKYDKL